MFFPILNSSSILVCVRFKNNIRNSCRSCFWSSGGLFGRTSSKNSIRGILRSWQDSIAHWIELYKYELYTSIVYGMNPYRYRCGHHWTISTKESRRNYLMRINGRLFGVIIWNHHYCHYLVPHNIYLIRLLVRNNNPWMITFEGLPWSVTRGYQLSLPYQLARNRRRSLQDRFFCNRSLREVSSSGDQRLVSQTYLYLQPWSESRISCSTGVAISIVPNVYGKMRLSFPKWYTPELMFIPKSPVANNPLGTYKLRAEISRS